MWTYEQARDYVVDHLRQDAEAHVRGRYDQIGKGYDDFDGNLPRGAGIEFDKLYIALRFWDEWIYARNHLWHSPVVRHEKEWPRFAHQIADRIAADDDITESRILKKFGPSSR